MKNIIMRAGISPLDNFDPTHMILNNSIGGNVGNLMYQYSVVRNLMTEDTVITPDYYNYSTDDKRADEINEKYDCYVIPLADAFRPDFVPTLRKYTKLIKKLKIPVVVIGAGLRAPFEPDLDGGFPFDKDVKEFVSAVLEKSSMLGLRGQITADYLTRLGFREGVDHTVIGCPSLYAFGRDLTVRDTNITTDSIVSINSSRLSPDNVLEFIGRSSEQFPNHYFVPQWMREFVMTYTGSPSVNDADDKNYPNKMSHPMYMNDKVRFFLNVPTWIDFLKGVDLSFGARLHGNVGGVLAGTPSLIIPKDARMRELTEYHGMAHIMADQIDEKTNLMDIIEKTDFHSVEKNAGRNFDYFIEFLNKNNLDHIHNYSYNEVPLDKEIAKMDLNPPVGPITGCTMEETVQRWETYYPKVNAKAAETEKKRKAQVKEKDKRIKEKDKQIKEKDKQIKEMKKTLNRRSVKLALKLAGKRK
ncbi:polysaccharide pyruvyl transferase [Alkalihalobacillus alcalophilus ATCC 27647 = CGMCC 1.3604]|uniref:Polysaccharide pyruvyl transferase n=1 Tax=Alkalihalobacillus alcalophilus ATCC 27647 = CGMCC 1.3604 TaxID=1218173 RepID=A0A094WLR9_ALKAL|nr:polysaccharide pyruvyl transferase family protein [Alkalihalobacillus alcalophilus]KGA96893.1 polysaccharide pyruvyl transferase [Alkalihalobacillus alcalophilus ATCC 27647 = CGMCC 1.3604]MED1562641.1 polysaccharide pyruvyl transferase family protein [Alkalihalobacillus alcalophilus]THG88599.1 polysaccharide pyruvyl transferase [Alkalihalobacillus alcalophilus ATCC 27647 = CGMCC 1.3604]